MANRAVTKQIDKDAIIAGLQTQIEDLKDQLAAAITEDARLTELNDANFKNGAAWKSAAEDARKERDKAQREETAAIHRSTGMEGRLRFAEGYIAALKGEVYSSIVGPKSDETVDLYHMVNRNG